MTTRQRLDSDWFVRALDPDGLVPAGLAAATVPASVPGTVHTDLLAAGLIADPYVGEAEKELSWIGRTDWEYKTSFEAPVDGVDRVDLVCEGLDTIATVALNGVELGQTANMHRSYRFDLAPATSAEANDLSVRFDSPLRYAETVEAELGKRPHSYFHPYNMIRKMACNFGWDWGPVFVTSGIWRPIYLHRWSTGRLASVRPLVTVEGDCGQVTVHVLLERAGNALPLTVTADVSGVSTKVHVPPGEVVATVELAVPNVRRWWPRGFGDQARYDLTVALRNPSGEVLDTWQRTIGFRTVELDTEPDADGTPYTVVVNDQPIFVRGMNWIPDDCFPHRVTRERYAGRIGAAAAANVNFLRVWGGGIYESDAFYDVCAQLGIMVGQDFLLCCAGYPEEAPISDEIAAEAEENVTRLAPHPSLIWWNGNNECSWGHEDWGWKDELGELTWGESYYHDVFPKIVSTLDPTRPYWPGSPHCGTDALAAGVHPNDPAHGTTHIWNPWVRVHDYHTYREYLPRFAAEYGYQAPAAFATLRDAVGEGGLTVDSAELANRQKASGGADKLALGMAGKLREPTTFDDWMWLTQLNQARAVRFAIEHFRSHRGRCMGSVVWQLNDCWPVISWSAVDSAGHRKPLWYALRRAYEDRLLTIQPRDDGLALVAVNDTTSEWRADVTVVRHDLTGRELASVAIEIDLPPGSAGTFPLPQSVAVAADAAREFIRAGEDTWWFFAEDVDAAYPQPVFDAEATRLDGAVQLQVTAHTFVKDLAVFPDRIGRLATVDDHLVTLLPGETAELTVRGLPDESDLSRITGPPVLRCANDA